MTKQFLLYRVCLGPQCHAVFLICSHCDRGHGYCSTACRDQARRQQRQRANKRHQRARKGGSIIVTASVSTGADAAKKQARVTDQGFPFDHFPASCPCGPADQLLP